MAELVLGPLLRHVAETTATVWVETDAACEVEVLGRRARTFRVAGHHYGLVAIEGLEPDSTTPTASSWTASRVGPSKARASRRA